MSSADKRFSDFTFKKRVLTTFANKEVDRVPINYFCISTSGPVAYGSVDDVVEDVSRTLTIMMPGGGYCFSPTHSLQDNSPTENVVAMYRAAQKFGLYCK